ncbi:MAG: hypothetical protein IJ048_12375 [Clostridia bacterium]|nr:hypothetical protein [Clostridia bacterium]
MTYVHFDAEDIRKNALPAAVGCICFPVPLIFCPKSAFGRFCANQGLILLLAYIAVNIVFGILRVLTGWIPLIGWIVTLIGLLARAVIVLAGFYLAWQAYQGRPARVPYIGEFDLIK